MSVAYRTMDPSNTSICNVTPSLGNWNVKYFTSSLTTVFLTSVPIVISAATVLYEQKKIDWSYKN